MVYKNILDYETANEWFYYDETSPTGLRWKKSKRNVVVGMQAGTLHYRYSKRYAPGTPNYVGLIFNGKCYVAHAIIWLLCKGVWPVYELDHKDRNTHNNVITNLREATSSFNNANKGVHKNNKLGTKGVSIISGRFRARIEKDGRNIHIGYFDTIEEAKAAYDAKAKELYGEFARSA